MRITFCLLLSTLMVQYLSAQTIAGKWKTVDDESGKEKSVIEIYEARDGKFYGKVLKVLDTSKGANPLCTKCPDDRKDQPIVGMLVIKALIKSGNEWSGGKILDPEKGKEYSCKLWVEGDKLKVRGYWGVFYRTQTWYKI